MNRPRADDSQTGGQDGREAWQRDGGPRGTSEERPPIDRWMFRIFGRPQGEEWYPWVAQCVAQLAAEEGVPVHEMQAVLWVAVIAASGHDVARIHPVAQAKRGDRHAA